MSHEPVEKTPPEDWEYLAWLIIIMSDHEGAALEDAICYVVDDYRDIPRDEEE